MDEPIPDKTIKVSLAVHAALDRCLRAQQAKALPFRIPRTYSDALGLLLVDAGFLSDTEQEESQPCHVRKGR